MRETRSPAATSCCCSRPLSCRGSSWARSRKLRPEESIMADGKWRIALFIVVAVLAVVALAAWYAPYVRSELSPYTAHYDIVDPAPARIAKGHMVDDYFAVEDVGDN